MACDGHPDGARSGEVRARPHPEPRRRVRGLYPKQTLRSRLQASAAARLLSKGHRRCVAGAENGARSSPCRTTATAIPLAETGAHSALAAWAVTSSSGRRPRRRRQAVALRARASVHSVWLQGRRHHDSSPARRHRRVVEAQRSRQAVTRIGFNRGERRDAEPMSEAAERKKCPPGRFRGDERGCTTSRRVPRTMEPAARTPYRSSNPEAFRQRLQDRNRADHDAVPGAVVELFDHQLAASRVVGQCTRRSDSPARTHGRSESRSRPACEAASADRHRRGGRPR